MKLPIEFERRDQALLRDSILRVSPVRHDIFMVLRKFFTQT